LNCWHVDPHESAAMWRLYLKSNEGIAIESSVGQLRESFSQHTEKIHIGMATYIDYATEWIRKGTPFLHKRKSFAHEKELRALMCRWPPLRSDKRGSDWANPAISDGIHVPVDLEKLISRVIVAPKSPPWLYRLVESVTRKYGISAPVKTSSLSTEPVWRNRFEQAKNDDVSRIRMTRKGGRLAEASS